ncbi:MAG: hypothetical protein CL607_24490 [Anaerolineaceae bacterium]|nr:hypothetical protein [Anaerolineaceae bacterium]
MAEIIRVFNEIHAVIAGRTAHRLAQQIGFPLGECTAIHIATLEVTRNILEYAGHGQVLFEQVERQDVLGIQLGIEIQAIDNGPGIPDLEAVLQDGFSTGKGLGKGLPGAKRLMDDFEITSDMDKGTSITMRKWKL